MRAKKKWAPVVRFLFFFLRFFQKLSLVTVFIHLYHDAWPLRTKHCDFYYIFLLFLRVLQACLPLLSSSFKGFQVQTNFRYSLKLISSSFHRIRLHIVYFDALWWWLARSYPSTIQLLTLASIIIRSKLSKFTTCNSRANISYND